MYAYFKLIIIKVFFLGGGGQRTLFNNACVLVMYYKGM